VALDTPLITMVDEVTAAATAADAALVEADSRVETAAALAAEAMQAAALVAAVAQAAALAAEAMQAEALAAEAAASTVAVEAEVASTVVAAAMAAADTGKFNRFKKERPVCFGRRAFLLP